MKNRILGLSNLSGYQASKMVAASFYQMAAAIPKNLRESDHALKRRSRHRPRSPAGSGTDQRHQG
jgi:hypothetical protein